MAKGNDKEEYSRKLFSEALKSTNFKNNKEVVVCFNSRQAGGVAQLNTQTWPVERCNYCNIPRHKAQKCWKRLEDISQGIIRDKYADAAIEPPQTNTIEPASPPDQRQHLLKEQLLTTLKGKRADSIVMIMFEALDGTNRKPTNKDMVRNKPIRRRPGDPEQTAKVRSLLQGKGKSHGGTV
jgi:hypothetical protein